MLHSSERRFSQLPLRGSVKDLKKYWSSDYWPLNKGSINFRWNTPVPSGFNNRSPNYDEILRMDQSELAQLSPAEKFDLLKGDYTYPLKKRILRTATPTRRDWEGICHGWAAAALNHNEPIPKVLVNPEGIHIPFGSSDVKALLSYYYANRYKPVSTYQMGRRCDGTNHCRIDLNAGAFHVVLANKLGRKGKSFILDIDNKREVWNQVAFSYSSSIVDDNRRPTSSSAPGTKKLIRIKTQLLVVFNILQNSWEPVIGTSLQTYKDMNLEYDLDIDAGGKIIGGEWHSKERPDFMWFVTEAKSFGEEFQPLTQLLND